MQDALALERERAEAEKQQIAAELQALREQADYSKQELNELEELHQSQLDDLTETNAHLRHQQQSQPQSGRFADEAGRSMARDGAQAFYAPGSAASAAAAAAAADAPHNQGTSAAWPEHKSFRPSLPSADLAATQNEQQLERARRFLDQQSLPNGGFNLERSLAYHHSALASALATQPFAEDDALLSRVQVRVKVPKQPVAELSRCCAPFPRRLLLVAFCSLPFIQS